MVRRLPVVLKKKMKRKSKFDNNSSLYPHLRALKRVLVNFRYSEEAAKPKLPKPALGESALQTSVFSNPFVEAELAKAAILEKHVKMVHVDFLPSNIP